MFCISKLQIDAVLMNVKHSKAFEIKRSSEEKQEVVVDVIAAAAADHQCSTELKTKGA